MIHVSNPLGKHIRWPQPQITASESSRECNPSSSALYYLSVRLRRVYANQVVPIVLPKIPPVLLRALKDIVVNFHRSAPVRIILRHHQPSAFTIETFTVLKHGEVFANRDTAFTPVRISPAKNRAIPEHAVVKPQLAPRPHFRSGGAGMHGIHSVTLSKRASVLCMYLRCRLRSVWVFNSRRDFLI